MLEISPDWPNIPIQIMKNKTKRTVLQWCFEVAAPERAKEIIKKGGNPFTLTQQRESCLHLACISGDKKTIQLALSLDLSTKNKTLANQTPLDLLKIFHPKNTALHVFLESLSIE